jgi:hypothetical protein
LQKVILLLQNIIIIHLQQQQVKFLFFSFDDQQISNLIDFNDIVEDIFIISKKEKFKSSTYELFNFLRVSEHNEEKRLLPDMLCLGIENNLDSRFNLKDVKPELTYLLN